MSHVTPPKLLLTGFEPFDRFKINPSWEAAKACAKQFGPEVFAARLPVDFQLARQQLCELLLLHRPVARLCMGLAPTPEFRLEMQARKPVQFGSIAGEACLSGHWPMDQMEQSLRSSGAAVRRSTDAGQYVCESTYWTLLDFRDRNGWPEYVGFLHVPCMSEEYPVERIIAYVSDVVNEFLKIKKA